MKTIDTGTWFTIQVGIAKSLIVAMNPHMQAQGVGMLECLLGFVATTAAGQLSNTTKDKMIESLRKVKEVAPNKETDIMFTIDRLQR